MDKQGLGLLMDSADGGFIGQLGAAVVDGKAHGLGILREEEDQHDISDGPMAWDDVSCVELDAVRVRKAQAEEVHVYRTMRV